MILITCQLIVVGVLLLQVYFEQVTVLSLILFVVSLVLAIRLLDKNFYHETFHACRHFFKNHIFFVTILCLLQLYVLLFFFLFPLHFIQDEFITAYISYTLPSLPEINWFGAFPKSHEWVSQFPSVFFLLQKPFFFLFGPSVEAIRVSIWPYHLGIILYLYAFANFLWKEKIPSFLIVVCYIFFAPALYISTLGVHFTSSTFFFLAAFYHVFQHFQTQKNYHSVLAGIYLALCYLSYSSSYIALPLFILIIITEAVFTHSFAAKKTLWQVLFIFSIFLAPFLVFAFTKTNYFLQRVNQVSIFSASPDLLSDPVELLKVIWQYTKQNLQSLYLAGEGGVNDYWFGHQAFFTPLMLMLFFYGVGLFLYTLVIKRNSVYLFPIFTISLIFFFSMVFTLPVGAFHRFSLAYPLLGLVIGSLFLSLFMRLKKSSIKISVIFIVLTLYLGSNFHHIFMMFNKDAEISNLLDSVPLASYLTQHVSPEKPVLISAFPSYHLERELTFRTYDNHSFTTNYLPSLLESNIKAPIILSYPDDIQLTQIREKYPSIHVIDTIEGIKLKHHLLILPN